MVHLRSFQVHCNVQLVAPSDTVGVTVDEGIVEQVSIIDFSINFSRLLEFDSLNRSFLDQFTIWSKDYRVARD